MQILSVSLKNFKTHRDRHFTFAKGTNAICGENGAGKTSILEAIAWVLFNYIGDYAKDDLVRNGSGSAEVTVDFISNLDGRTYTVQRHTTRGYTLFDPQLNERLPYTRIKDEVLPWLREHLGVSSGTDLGELFARTVGVPQGTFTADFLQTAENRKAVFDKVLKVEEYKTVYKDLNSLRRYAEAKVEAVGAEITRYEERLAAWDELQTRHQAAATEITQNQAQLAAFTSQMETLQQERAILKTQLEHVQQLHTQRQEVQAQIDGKQQAIALLTQSLAQAKQATQICADTRPAYEAYQAAEVQLQTLGQQQTQRQSLQKRQQTLQKTLETRSADITRLKVQLDGFQAAVEEITQLQVHVQQQNQLEAKLKDLLQQQTVLAKLQGELQAMEGQAAQQTQQLQKQAQDIAQLRTLEATVAEIPGLEQQRDRLQQQLSRVEAARQFETDLRQLADRGQVDGDRYQSQIEQALQTLERLQTSQSQFPTETITILSSALRTGAAIHDQLLSAVQQILTDLSAQTDAKTLKSQLQTLRKRLTELGKQQAAVATIPERQQHLDQLQSQQVVVRERIQLLQGQLSDEATVSTQVTDIQALLVGLEDPKGRCAVLERSRKQQPTVQKRYDEMQAAQSGIQQQIEAVDTQVKAFEQLDEAIAAQNQIKQTHQTGYLQYLQYERAAHGEAQLTQDLTTAQQALTQLQHTRDTVQADLDKAQADFDPQKAQQVDAAYQEIRSQHDRLSGSLPQQQQLLAELQRQIDALTDAAQKRDAALEERKKRERIKRFINFARKAYKEAGPRITERYVQQIAREGDRLFRELLNRPNVALTWTRDYEILVQEGPNTRRFVNLSGGEQMCAALAIRLALLKVLADIDIAFFDEPTTNMDRSRRESLAEAIARIRSFNQLFVISHDDTFEKVTENVIVVERDN
ncbi:SMC family ATPase [Oscillatoria sp. CS-180]|uniref:AAA family ATPase n=1 Tax=Oscillatoria sp. CS-180 TaxID=3021720 RepID=UPI00232E072D|nr:SMC family ATPase [Oscillatoria sp. CS-180]MDB9528016.1 SMC family ATPase [Oscillatoria sp. CS-180]